MGLQLEKWGLRLSVRGRQIRFAYPQMDTANSIWWAITQRPQKWSGHFRDRKPSARESKFFRNSKRKNLLYEDFEWWILRIASFMDKAGEAISTPSFALTYSLLLSTDVRRSLSLQRGKYVISFCFSLFKQSGINYPPTSSVPLSFKKGASFLMLSFNQLSHSYPLQEEDIWYPGQY